MTCAAQSFRRNNIFDAKLTLKTKFRTAFESCWNCFKKKDARDNSFVIIIHGGTNEYGKLEDSFFLDPPEGKFNKIPESRAEFRVNNIAIALENKIYFLGGKSGRFHK